MQEFIEREGYSGMAGVGDADALTVVTTCDFEMGVYLNGTGIRNVR